MKRERSVELAKRMLNLLDTKSTELAPSVYERKVSAFTSPEVHAREREVIFARTPMFLGMSSELPKPGSYFTRDIAGAPFLAVRRRDGTVGLYLNSCRHRGVKVALERCGSSKLHVCPFHAWSYDLDGALVGVPEPDAFEGMDRKTHGLVALPVAEKYGLIYGCATPGLEFDIDEALGGLGPELEEWGFANFQVYQEPHVHQVQGNWKYAWDTFCENYHFSTLHKNTLTALLHSSHQAFDTFGRNVRIISAWRSIEEMRQQPEADWNPINHLSIQYRLFPSVNFTVLPGFMAVYWITPGRGPSHAEGLHVTYVPRVPQTEAEREKLDAAIWHGCENVVQNEDFWMTQVAQDCMLAPAAPESLVIGRNEWALQHFHRLYDEAVETGVLPHRPPREGDDLEDEGQAAAQKARAPALTDGA